MATPFTLDNAFCALHSTETSHHSHCQVILLRFRVIDREYDI